MEVLVNDSGTASFTYTAPINTTSIVYSVYDNINDKYIQYEEVNKDFDPGSVVTISIGSPAEFSQTDHELVDGDIIKFSTTGSLPTGLSINQNYYVKTTQSKDHFNVYLTSPSVLVNTSGTQSGVHKEISQGQDLYQISLNAESCKYDRDLTIEIQSIQVDGYSEDSLDIRIKRPYATVSEIRSYFENIAFEKEIILEKETDDFIQKLERKVRYLINSYIGDEFKFEYKTVGAFGIGTDLLHLGQRIESFDKITYNDYVTYDSTEEPVLDELGVSLAVAPSKYAIKVVAPGVNIAEWTDQNPLISSGYFTKDSSYLVRGEYGWKAVPEDIKIAVYELINDELCTDSIYANKGLKSIKNDSFSLEFAESMGASTGNKYVDALLSPYKVWNLKAI